MLKYKNILCTALTASILVTSLSMTVQADEESYDAEISTSSSYSDYYPRAGVSLSVAKTLAAAEWEAEPYESTEEEEAYETAEANRLAPADYSNVAIAQVDNYVNIRAEANEDSEKLGKLYNNSAAFVEATEGDWYKITSGSVTGYVKAEYVVTGDAELAEKVSRRVATVNTQTLYVRYEPSTDSKVMGMVPLGDDLTVVSEDTLSDGWVQVSVDEGDGYVSCDYISLSTEYTYAESKAEEEARLAKEEAERKAAAAAAAAAKKKSSSSSSSSGSSSKTYSAASGSNGQAVVNYACQFVGNPYVYGGSSLTNGTDCSGFVMSVYSAFGVSLPHSSSADRSVGYGVSTSEMQAGDIVCYSGHVAIYCGNGTIVHASNARTGITYSNVNYKTILAVRRIF